MTKRFLTKADGTRLRGDRQFASNQVFRTKFRNCPRDLTVHVARGFKSLSNHLSACFTTLVEFLEENVPRQVDINVQAWVHAYVDASSDPTAPSAISAVTYDSTGECVGCFSEVVTPKLVHLTKKVIFEFEGLAVATALHVFKKTVKGRKLVIFTDSCLMKCKPNKDVPSREKFTFFDGKKCTAVELEAMWFACLAETLKSYSCGGSDARQVRLVQIPVVKNNCGSRQLLSGVRFVSAYTQKKEKNSNVFGGILFSEDGK